MTALEMQEEFLVNYDKITNYDAPGYIPKEISLLLSKAQERLVLDSYNPLANKYREGFESTEARRKDLQELVSSANLSPSVGQVGTLPNGTFFDLPNDCLYVVHEHIITESEDVCKNNINLKIKPVTTDYYDINITNPFKNPNILRNAWRLDYNTRRHEIVTDGTFNVDTYTIRYIKKPIPIIIDNSTIDGVTGPSNCQLNSIMHRRIVDEAVKIATSITDPQFYQIKTIEQQQGE